VRVAEQAAKLAMHFDQGRDYGRAAPYRRQAAENALQRHAYHQAMGHLARGLEVLQTLPASHEVVRHELELQILLGLVLTVTKGFAASEAGAYARARNVPAGRGHAPPVSGAVGVVGVFSGASRAAHRP
jgi:hypothetical protein